MTPLLFFSIFLQEIGSVKDICNGSEPEITNYYTAEVRNSTHCFFEPPPDEKVSKPHHDGDRAQAFNIDPARDHCKKYDARLPQLYDCETFVGLLSVRFNISQNMTAEVKGLTWWSAFGYVPLGLTIEGVYEYHVEAIGDINITRKIVSGVWDNGRAFNLSETRFCHFTFDLNSPKNAQWNFATPDNDQATVLKFEDGDWETMDAKRIPKLLLLCHQDPNYPVGTIEESSSVAPTQSPTAPASADTSPSTSDTTSSSANGNNRLCIGLTILAAATVLWRVAESRNWSSRSCIAPT